LGELRESPLCPTHPEELEPKVAIREPRGMVRLLSVTVVVED
jgi:penicillin-binding protein 1C